MKEKKVFDYDNLCETITSISFISVIIFICIQLIYYFFNSSGLLEVLFPKFLEDLFIGLLFYYGLGTLLFLIIYPFWVIFNFILEVIRILKFIRKKEIIKFINIFKLVICCILYGFVCWFFFVSVKQIF